ncbi:MAG: nicotinamidase [Nitrososphaerales archaeon]|nr:nicotinamidase [Nitrososphaerales archaeon]
MTSSPKAALIVVDVQNDFCPGGKLAVKEGDSVVPPLNRAIESFWSAGLPVVFTRDWHPPNHCSFKEHGGIWPPHCIAGTDGAEFHADLEVPDGSVIISKATRPDFEAYSGFQGTDLEKQLESLGVKELFVGGLATDYCVKQTSLDALAAGFKVEVMTDCVRGVEAKVGDSASALRLMSKKGAKLTTSAEAIKQSRRAAIGSSS